MQGSRFLHFYLVVLCTAFITIQTVCHGNAQVISSEEVSSSSSKPEEEGAEYTTDEGKSETVGVALSGEAQLTESTMNKGSMKDANVTTLPPTVVSLYTLTRDGVPCILLQVDASVTFTYTTKSGEERNESEYIPEDVITSGDCKEQDSATLHMKWKVYTLTWSFAKTPGRELWYVNGVKLSLDASDKPFQNINKPGARTLSTPKSHVMLFPTPVGKSYSCQSETSVELHDGDMSATVFLRGFKFQPFTDKREFDPEYECSPGGGRAFRDETAPIAVGSTLAIVVLLTVTGYGVYRYFKIKKVQYDTME